MAKRVSVKNKYNKKLSTLIEVPRDEVKDFIIISHCFTCSKLYKLYDNVSKILVEKGYGVVRYDAMGIGESEGDFSDTSFSTNVEDLITVYDYISENYKEARYLFGHSLGSLVSIKAANNLEAVIGVATVGGPPDFSKLIKIFSQYEKELVEKEKILADLGGRKINIGLNYLENARSKDPEEILKNFKKSIIIFQSNSDQIVPYSEGLRLFNTINSKKSFIGLENVDHLVSEKKDGIYIGHILYEWLENL